MSSLIREWKKAMKHHKFNSDEIGWYILLRIRIRSCLCSEVGPGSRSKPDRIRNTRRDQVKLEVFFLRKTIYFCLSFSNWQRSIVQTSKWFWHQLWGRRWRCPRGHQSQESSFDELNKTNLLLDNHSYHQCDTFPRTGYSIVRTIVPNTISSTQITRRL